MHTVDKGEVSRYLAIAHFIGLGWSPSKPVSENCPYDLIVDCEDKLYRVQIKTAKVMDDLVEIRLASSNSNYVKKYSSEDIDWLVGVDVENRKFYRLIYGINFSERRQINLRLKPPQYNRTKDINWAKDFEI